jgi:2,4-dienoyl-CoA reductase-like NADH-dependent reductase (Old Yellow Enzyme family)
MAHLFDPLTFRSITLRNRIGVSPMCQYSYIDGFPNDWQLVHLGSRAVGGAGMVFAEATAVEDRGRITPADLGIWKDAHVEPHARLAAFIKSQGAVAGIQLAHAGRKASTSPPWEGGKGISIEQGGWEPIAPSPLAFDADYPQPREMTLADIDHVRQSFVAATRRAEAAGYECIEIHAAHGYLLHSFLSPLSNQRRDAYGGSFEHRIRLLLEVAADIRRSWDDAKPMFVRLSCTDWLPGGWDLEQSVALAQRLKPAGVDLIDCSSGGGVAHVKIPIGPGFQVPFAKAIRAGAGIATAAVGMITQPQQAEQIITDGSADMVLLAREMLRDPYWPLHAAAALGRREEVFPPKQYGRAFA